MGKSDLPLSSLAGFPSLGEGSESPMCPPVPAGAWGLRAAKLASVRGDGSEAGAASDSAATEKKVEEELSSAGSRQGSGSAGAAELTASPRSPKTTSTCAEAPAHEANEGETDEDKQQPSGDFRAEDAREEAVSAEPAEELVEQWTHEASCWSKAEGHESAEASLRHFLAPLSREQLLDLLSWAALRDRNVYQHCADRVHASPSSRRLMVRNVHFSTTDERFTTFFETFGCVDDALIVRERDGHSRGYGFVTFAFPEGVNRCFVACPLTLDGRQLHIKLAADLFTSREQTKLFVRNLHDQTTAETLREIFSPFGTLEECVVVRDAEGRSKGYGFLNFSTPMEAFKAVQMSERIIDGRMVFIHFASSSAKGGSKSGGSQSSRAVHNASKSNYSSNHRRPTSGGMATDNAERAPAAANPSWDYGSIQQDVRPRYRRDHQRGNCITPHRVPMSRCIGGPSAEPLMYPDGGFGDMYGFSLPPFPFLSPSQPADVKNPLPAAYAQFYHYPVGPYYPLAPDGPPPYGTQTASK